jgi:3-phytase
MKYNTPIAAAIAVALTSTANAAGLTSQLLWTFNHTAANGSTSMGSEIVAYDANNERLWVIGTDANEANLGLGGIDILDLSGQLIHGIDTHALGGINSVAVKNNQAAAAISAPTKTDAGRVLFFDTTDFSSLADVTVGANPDSVTFTPDGSRLLVANEGEPSSYLVGPLGDPEGSVSIIDAGTHQAQTADFSKFNAKAAKLKDKGVRLNGPNATVSQDLEPEYIAVNQSGSQAFVTLQEANAVAVINIPSAHVTAINPLGLKDHSLPDNGLDASDRDGPLNTALDGNIQNWAVKGMYMPDGIASFEKEGNQYYVTANEGDSRADWAGGNDEIRVGSASIDPSLDALLTTLHGADWKTNNDKLNRLNVSLSGDLDGDGDLDELQVFGARSFSILDESGNIVFDSGDQLEQIIKVYYPTLWKDDRSDNKGPEPESAVIGKVNGRDLLFLGLERSNAVMVWDLTDLEDIRFLDMIFVVGDVGPEGLSFFSNQDGSFLAVANEVSETTSLFSVSVTP